MNVLTLGVIPELDIKHSILVGLNLDWGKTGLFLDKVVLVRDQVGDEVEVGSHRRIEIRHIEQIVHEIDIHVNFALKNASHFFLSRAIIPPFFRSIVAFRDADLQVLVFWIPELPDSLQGFIGFVIEAEQGRDSLAL